MIVVANTSELVEEQVISASAQTFMIARSRDIMTSLAINAVLIFGILAATGGLIFWLGDPLSVAVCGAALLGLGLAVLRRAKAGFAMLGNAAALIGAGQLIGGGALELMDKYEPVAGPIMLVIGTGIVALMDWRRRTGALSHAFVQGCILLMGLTVHLVGLWFWLDHAEATAPLTTLAHLYSTAALALAGWRLDVRLITALAIVPFAQMLDTGTGYFGASYAFWSPESTLTILQMTTLIVIALRASRSWEERDRRHAQILVILAFVVANLSALVGSLYGDVVGSALWGPAWAEFEDWTDYSAARDAFRDTTLAIPHHIYAIGWGVALALTLGWAARHAQRGLFNGAMTFAAIHAYTQLFESFQDEALAFVIGGFGAIGLAWGMWRLNQAWSAKQKDRDTA